MEQYFGIEFRAAARAAFGCMVDPGSSYSAKLFGAEYVKSKGRHVMCFCYRAVLDLSRMIRIAK